MIDFKKLFNILENAYENDFGVDYVDLIHEEIDYYIEDHSDHPHGEYIIFTNEFILRITSHVFLNDEEEGDTGEWERTYDAEDITSQYGKVSENVNYTDKSMAMSFIEIWINETVLEN
jgi:hypothetical protein